MPNSTDVKYLNKDFSSFKSDLIEYAKSYYPTVYNDFTQASPGSMFIEMAAYVGDVLSFYLDNQLQETFLQYAKQKGNLYSMAYMLGYRPKTTSAAVVDLEVYQQVPSANDAGSIVPDFTYAVTIAEGMQVRSNVNNSNFFYVPNKVDFTVSSSLDPTSVSTYTIDSFGVPTSFLLKKNTQAISGQIKTQQFNFGGAERFVTVNLQDTDIITILKVQDSDGNLWYEVPYLAQDYILNPVTNTAANYPEFYQSSNQVPYMIEKLTVPRRFTTRYQADGTMNIEFGSGINQVSDTSVIPNPNTVGVGLTSGLTLLNTAFDPTNFVTTQTYGLSPQNTVLTFTYLVGGGAVANVLSNELTYIVNKSVTAADASFQNTIVTNNSDPASGGGDGDSDVELKLNIQAEFSSQLRAVTQEDYLARCLSMPSKFGKISKAYITKDDATYTNYLAADNSQRDQILVSLYVLGLDNNNHLAVPSMPLMTNLKNYISDYRMLTDSINIKSAYIINIGCNFDIVIRPNYTSQDVLARCITSLQNYFDKDNWQINQPIILGDLYALLDQIEGVQTVKEVSIINKSGEANNYSKYSYDIKAATLNNVIYPSLDPSIFELKFSQTDIKGRVVTF
jgi:hypothetical protein